MSDAWWLYVDESGNFAEETDQVVVAGLLLKDQATAAGQATLKTRLLGAAPHVPWPLHASQIKIPTMHALWAIEAGPKHCSTKLLSVSSAAIDVLTKPETDALTSVRADLSARRTPRWNELRRLETTLSGTAPSIHAVLTDVARDVQTEIRHTVTTLARLWLEEDNARVVCCSEPLPGDASPPTNQGDRYLSLLETMAERLLDFMCWTGGKHVVNLRVLRRNVRDSTLGVETPLHVRHLQSMVRTLADSNRLGAVGRAHQVTLNPFDVPRYDETVHPGLVVADLIANHLRKAIYPGGDLRNLSMRAQRLIAFPLLFGAPAVPTIAATGAPRRRVSEARRKGKVNNGNGDAGALEDPRLYLWAREQALRWIEVFSQ